MKGTGKRKMKYRRKRITEKEEFRNFQWTIAKKKQHFECYFKLSNEKNNKRYLFHKIKSNNLFQDRQTDKSHREIVNKKE
jgi:hypothetical protein